MSDQVCKKCGLRIPLNHSHSTVFACNVALKSEVERQDRTINTLSERVLELEKELREKEWERATQ